MYKISSSTHPKIYPDLILFLRRTKDMKLLRPCSVGDQQGHPSGGVLRPKCLLYGDAWGNTFAETSLLALWPSASFLSESKKSFHN